MTSLIAAKARARRYVAQNLLPYSEHRISTTTVAAEADRAASIMQELLDALRAEHHAQ